MRFEDQGWFTATAYKPQQGQRSAAARSSASCSAAAAGIYTMINHSILRRLPDNWELNVPFTGT